MSYVKCHKCKTMVHFKPLDVVKFEERFVQKGEPVYCYSCFMKKNEENREKATDQEKE